MNKFPVKQQKRIKIFPNRSVTGPLPKRNFPRNHENKLTKFQFSRSWQSRHSTSYLTLLLYHIFSRFTMLRSVALLLSRLPYHMIPMAVQVILFSSVIKRPFWCDKPVYRLLSCRPTTECDGHALPMRVSFRGDLDNKLSSKTLFSLRNHLTTG